MTATSASTSGSAVGGADDPLPAAALARRAIADAGGLVTAKEIAAAWGLTPQAIADRIARGTFPDPVKDAGRGVRLYLRAEVEPFRDAATAAGAATAKAIKDRRAPERKPPRAG